jgi:hypothetical protein
MTSVYQAKKNVSLSSITFGDNSVLTSAKTFKDDIHIRKKLRVQEDVKINQDLYVDGKIYGSLAELDPLAEEYTNLRTGWPWPVKDPDGETFVKANDSLWTHVDIIEKAPYATEKFVLDSTSNTLSFIRILPIEDGGEGFYTQKDPLSKYTIPVTCLASQNIFLIRNDTTTQQFFKFQDGQTSTGKVLVALDDDGTVGWGDANINEVVGDENIHSDFGQSISPTLTISDDGASVQPRQDLFTFMNFPSVASSNYNQLIQAQTIATLGGRFQNGFYSGSQPSVLFGSYSLGSEGVLFKSGFLNSNSEYISGFSRLSGGKKTLSDQSILLTESGIDIFSDETKIQLWSKIAIRSRVNSSSTNYSQPHGLIYPEGPAGIKEAILEIGEDLSLERNGSLDIYGKIKIKPFGGLNMTENLLPYYLKAKDSSGDAEWTHFPIDYFLPTQKSFNITCASGRNEKPVSAFTKSSSDLTTKKTLAILPWVNGGNYNPAIEEGDILILAADSSQYDADPGNGTFYPETKDRMALSVWSRYGDGIFIRPSLFDEESVSNPLLSGYVRLTAAAHNIYHDEKISIPNHYLEINRNGITIVNGEGLSYNQDTQTKIYGKLKILSMATDTSILNNTNPNENEITGELTVGDDVNECNFHLYGGFFYHSSAPAEEGYVLMNDGTEGKVKWEKLPFTVDSIIKIDKPITFLDDLTLSGNLNYVTPGITGSIIAGAIGYSLAQNGNSDSSGVKNSGINQKSQFYWKFPTNGDPLYSFKILSDRTISSSIVCGNTYSPDLEYASVSAVGVIAPHEIYRFLSNKLVTYNFQKTIDGSNYDIFPNAPSSFKLLGDFYFRTGGELINSHYQYSTPNKGDVLIYYGSLIDDTEGELLYKGEWKPFLSLLPTSTTDIHHFNNEVIIGSLEDYQYSVFGDLFSQTKNIASLKVYGKIFFKNGDSPSSVTAPIGYFLKCKNSDGELEWGEGDSLPTSFSFENLSSTISTSLSGNILIDGNITSSATNTFSAKNTFTSAPSFNFSSPAQYKILTCTDSSGSVGWQTLSSIPDYIPNNLSIDDLIVSNSIEVTNNVKINKDQMVISSHIEQRSYPCEWYLDAARTSSVPYSEILYPYSINDRSSPYYLRFKTELQHPQISQSSPTNDFDVTKTGLAKQAILINQLIFLNHSFCYKDNYQGNKNNQEYNGWYRIENITVKIYKDSNYNSVWQSFTIPTYVNQFATSPSCIFVRHDQHIVLDPPANPNTLNVSNETICNTNMTLVPLKFSFFPDDDSLTHKYSFQYDIDMQYQYDHKEIRHTNSQGDFNPFTLVVNPTSLFSSGWFPYYSPPYSSSQSEWQNMFAAIYYYYPPIDSAFSTFRPIPYTIGNNYTGNALLSNASKNFSIGNTVYATDESYVCQTQRILTKSVFSKGDIISDSGVVKACGLAGRQGYPINGTSKNISGSENYFGSYGSWGSLFNFWWNGNVEIWVDYTKVASIAQNVSDYRLKENLKTPGRVLERLAYLPIYNYDLKDSQLTQNSKDHIGVLAHELQELFPEFPHLVDGKKDATVQDASCYQFINHNEIIFLLMKSIQELKDQVDYLTEEVAKLRGP